MGRESPADLRDAEHWHFVLRPDSDGDGKKSPDPLFTKYAGNQPVVQPVWAASNNAARFSNGISGVKTLAGLTR